MLHFGDDVEAVEIIRERFSADKLFNILDYRKYPHLSRYGNGFKSDKALEKDKENVLGHLKYTLYAAYIKELYEKFILYLKDSLTVAVNDKKVRTQDILEKDELQKACSQSQGEPSVNLVFQILDQKKSTRSLVKRVCRTLNIDVDSSAFNRAMDLLCVRHSLVHSDGKVAEEFCSKYPDYVDDDGKIILSMKLMLTLKREVTVLIEKIDSSAIENGILQPNTPK